MLFHNVIHIHEKEQEGWARLETTIIRQELPIHGGCTDICFRRFWVSGIAERIAYSGCLFQWKTLSASRIRIE